MNIVVNGSPVEMPKEVITIADVKQHFKIDNPVVIVEHNGEILNKSVHTEKEVTDGDKIELVQFVGGG
ncbi:MAG TPA: sulfur carrier protein ThiS [Virgibacillus sp.]|nr:sulfur carrier protein ThiS [Virgibacillus sp.]